MIKQKRIKISKKHIEKGEPGNPQSCPIACAILDRQYVDRVDVDGEYITIEDSNGGHVYAMPARASNFVMKFDDGEEVHPFSFKLGRLVEEWDFEG